MTAPAVSERVCARQQMHRAHKWMLGRRLYQCPGSEDTVTIPRATAEHIRTHLERGCWAHADLTAALEDK